MCSPAATRGLRIDDALVRCTYPYDTVYSP
jgi:hypothetical protein